jgi:adenylate cyclase
MPLLRITDAAGRQWDYLLSPQTQCTIGRAADNNVALDDPRASRYHAHIKADKDGYMLMDGVVLGGELKRSANRVVVNGQPQDEHRLLDGDQITIGTSRLIFEDKEQETAPLKYEEGRLGRTQLTVSVNEVLREALQTKVLPELPKAELEALRRKADVLALLYELSKTLSTVFDLNTIFSKATEIIFRVTPADRVVALLRDSSTGSSDSNGAALRPVAASLRHEKFAGQAGRMNISRTITNKVLSERVALLTQDAAADEQLARAESIISQGVRSTICAPLVGESGVHGALYADRLDPFAHFTRDDLELITAIAAQTSVAVESVRAHERLAREEVARANYCRFMPDYVVRQLLEHPETFQLGGSNQIVTVLFADVRGFTRIAEQVAPERIVQLLNRYFSVMTEIIFAHGGTLDKFIGDGLMALFGAPTASPEDATNALSTAVAMQRQIKQINTYLRNMELREISIGIGLHTGVATVGYIGSERRTEFTAIGDSVNLAARLEQNAKGGEILLSDATARAARRIFSFKQREPLTVKNRVQPVPIYEVEWQQTEVPTGGQ